MTGERFGSERQADPTEWIVDSRLATGFKLVEVVIMPPKIKEVCDEPTVISKENPSVIYETPEDREVADGAWRLVQLARDKYYEVAICHVPAKYASQALSYTPTKEAYGIESYRLVLARHERQVPKMQD